MNGFPWACMLALGGLFFAQPSSAHAADACMDKAASSAQMGACAGADARAADAELDRVYRDVLRRHAKDRVFIAKLRTAQRAWIAFRDAEIAARYPAADPLPAYGDVFPMCAARLREELIRARTAQLRRWLDGVQEGDVCSGSLPLNGDTD